MSAPVSKCASCGAAIHWVKMQSGRAMPVDAKAEKRVVVEEGIGRVAPTFVSHFATCPNAAKHRKAAEVSP